jgi:hypothetical protein
VKDEHRKISFLPPLFVKRREITPAKSIETNFSIYSIAKNESKLKLESDDTKGLPKILLRFILPSRIVWLKRPLFIFQGEAP